MQPGRAGVRRPEYSAPNGDDGPEQVTEALHRLQVGGAAVVREGPQPRRQRRHEILEQRVEQVRLLLVLAQLRQGTQESGLGPVKRAHSAARRTRQRCVCRCVTSGYAVIDQLTIWMTRASAALLSAFWPDALTLIRCRSSAASSMIRESLTHAKLSLPPSAAILLTTVQMTPNHGENPCHGINGRCDTMGSRKLMHASTLLLSRAQVLVPS